MYFDRPGKENTQKVLELALQRAKELGIQEAVIASTRGNTALAACSVFAGSGIRLIAVAEHTGFAQPFKQLLSDDTRKELEAKGVSVVIATHALSGVERGFSKKIPGDYPLMIAAETLRLFGQGIKVCVEITVMAADAGYLSGRPLVAVGGTAQGADTAIVITPAHMNSFLDLKIHEIICKPDLFS
jgi:hypothetical protein